MKLEQLLLVVLLLSIDYICGFQFRRKTNVASTHLIASSFKLNSDVQSDSDYKLSQIAVVLLAGGKGTRMGAPIPKQFLKILGKEIFLHSLDVFIAMKEEVSTIVIVLDKSFREEYKYLLELDPRIVWADPGKERQDSVFNGLQMVPDTCKLVAIHDSARPLVTIPEIRACMVDAMKYRAAVLGVPIKATVKESADGEFVLRTIDRKRLWEIHTPQISTKDLFLKGFEKVKRENIEVTDDVSVIETLGLPVRLTLGKYSNIKLTSPDDLLVAEQVLKDRSLNQKI